MRDRKNSLTFWLFLAPVLLAFAVIIVIPFIIGAYLSLTDWNATARAGAAVQFVGFLNFTESFKDPSFIYSFIITTVFTVLNVVAVNVFAIVLALVVTSNLKLKNLYRAGFFIPYLIGGLILGYLWKFIFNNAIPAIGSVIPGLSFLADPANLILGNVNSALIATIVVCTWQYAGYIMLIYVAAIEGVPESLFEAARMDGASKWEQFRNITIPMIAQSFTITMFLTLVNSFKQFDVNYALTAGGPSVQFLEKPLFGTELLALDIYRTAFVSNNLAMGQARAVVFFVVLVIISLLQVRANKKREIEL